MKTVVCLLEERSAKEMLEVIFPKLLPDLGIRYICFEGKQDMDKKLKRRIQHYKVPDAVFLIIRDQDQGDCKTIKRQLKDKVPANKRDKSVIRIACRELESFYLGDLRAVEQGLNLTGLGTHQEKSKYRVPDHLSNAKNEMDKITKNAYQKIAGSRNIAPYLRLDGTNKSHSFNVLLNGIRKLKTISHHGNPGNAINRPLRNP